MSDSILSDLGKPDNLEEVCPCTRNNGLVYRDGEMIPCDNPNCNYQGKINVAPQVEQMVNADQLGFVPEAFRKRIFDSSMLYRSSTIPEDTKTKREFIEYVDRLEKMVHSTSAGLIPARSYFIAAPPGFGKNSAVYASIIGAMYKGLKVMPYYDAAQVREMIEKGKLPEGYYDVDILFIKMTTGNVTVSDLQTCKLVTERRARLSKPTIVTSRMPLGYFKSMEPSIVELIVDDTQEKDYFRWKYIHAPFTFYNGKR